jgi:hypothetical protein
MQMEEVHGVLHSRVRQITGQVSEQRDEASRITDLACCCAVCSDVVAFKTLPATTQVQSVNDTTEAASMGSGHFTFWDSSADDFIGSEILGDGGAITTAAACLTKCNTNVDCAAAIMTGATKAGVVASCKLVKGVSNEASPRRSMTKVVATKLVYEDTPRLSGEFVIIFAMFAGWVDSAGGEQDGQICLWAIVRLHR